MLGFQKKNQVRFPSSLDVATTESYKKGKTIYEAQCVACHQATGEGMEGAIPPLAKSDFLMADRNRAITVLHEGTEEEIKVNGKTYMGTMPKLGLKESEIAEVLTYVTNTWGNAAAEFTVDEVKKATAPKVEVKKAKKSKK